MAVTSCNLKKHKARMWQAGAWGDVREKVLGCVLRPNQPSLTMAPADLRTEPLPDGWSTMISLNLEGGNTEYLPNFPESLVRINLSGNKLKELPKLPQALIKLNVDKNQLTTLPALPPGILTLSVKRNKLKSFPEAPPRLTDLHITHNEITSLPSLAGTELTDLGLGFNQLTALPALPETLRTLGCANNQIKEISNLPNRLRVLSCSHNPLRSLKIDKLKRITHVIATNCGLTEIPVLPEVEFDEENNNEGPQLDPIEDRRQYYFEGNNLTPEFQAIYQRYRDAGGWHQTAAGEWVTREPGSTRKFRNEVLEEHRRILRQRASTVAALTASLKGPMGAQTPAAVRGMTGNYGPTNLIAQFITGLPGTLESQRLGVLEQREALRNVAPGTAARARGRIADVAARPNSSNFLRARAKLYVRRENIEAARRRYAAELDAELQRQKIEAEKKALLRNWGIMVKELRLRELEADVSAIQYETALSPGDSERVQEKYDALEDDLSSFSLDFGQGPNVDTVLTEKIHTAVKGDEIFKNYLEKKFKNYLWFRIRSFVLRVNDSAEGLVTTAARYPQIYDKDESDRELQRLNSIIENTVTQLFDGDDTDYINELNLLSGELQEFEAPVPLETIYNNVSEEERAEEEAAAAAVVALAENENEENGGNVEVINAGNNNNEGEALGIAMAQAAAENAENVAGGRRRRSTPRNRKSKRSTRKQK